MPHISKKQLNKEMTRKLEKYTVSIIRDAGSKSRVNILNELLTETEKIMLAKRIGILFFLKKGLSSYKISELLNVSPSTTERFERAFDSNKYKHTVNWVWKHSKEGSFEVFMESLVSLVFTRRSRSFKKFVDEL